MTTISKQQARKIALDAAGLARPGQFGAGHEAVYNVIDHLGFVQLDTNYTVERAHHHIIASRVPDYQVSWLQELQSDDRIYEYYLADAGYMPMRDFRFTLPIKDSFRSERSGITVAEVNVMNRILDRISREGPLGMKDFDDDRQEASSGWWDWRPAKIGMERLFQDGKLMVSRTGNFQKLYDLSENMIPADIDLAMPTAEEFARHVIRRELSGLGIAQVKELAWRARRAKNNLVKSELEKMVSEGEVSRVTVEGFPKISFYTLPSYKSKKIVVSDNAFILSPFDIINVFRHRLKEFFDFDYQIECFVPAPKRIYGYFSLPILVGNQFIARMDSKADRKKRTLIVHNLHFEPLAVNEAMLDRFCDALARFVRFNQCVSVCFMKTNKPKYQRAIQNGLIKHHIQVLKS